MKGGTSLRPDAARRRLARAWRIVSDIEICYLRGHCLLRKVSRAALLPQYWIVTAYRES